MVKMTTGADDDWGSPSSLTFSVDGGEDDFSSSSSLVLDDNKGRGRRKKEPQSTATSRKRKAKLAAAAATWTFDGNDFSDSINDDDDDADAGDIEPPPPPPLKKKKKKVSRQRKSASVLGAEAEQRRRAAQKEQRQQARAERERLCQQNATAAARRAKQKAQAAARQEERAAGNAAALAARRREKKKQRQEEEAAARNDEDSSSSSDEDDNVPLSELTRKQPKNSRSTCRPSRNNNSSNNKSKADDSDCVEQPRPTKSSSSLEDDDDDDDDGGKKKRAVASHPKASRRTSSSNDSVDDEPVTGNTNAAAAAEDEFFHDDDEYNGGGGGGDDVFWDDNEGEDGAAAAATASTQQSLRENRPSLLSTQQPQQQKQQSSSAYKSQKTFGGKNSRRASKSLQFTVPDDDQILALVEGVVPYQQPNSSSSSSDDGLDIFQGRDGERATYLEDLAHTAAAASTNFKSSRNSSIDNSMVEMLPKEGRYMELHSYPLEAGTWNILLESAQLPHERVRLVHQQYPHALSKTLPASLIRHSPVNPTTSRARSLRRAGILRHCDDETCFVGSLGLVACEGLLFSRGDGGLERALCAACTPRGEWHRNRGGVVLWNEPVTCRQQQPQQSNEMAADDCPSVTVSAGLAFPVSIGLKEHAYTIQLITDEEKNTVVAVEICFDNAEGAGGRDSLGSSNTTTSAVAPLNAANLEMHHARQQQDNGDDELEQVQHDVTVPAPIFKRKHVDEKVSSNASTLEHRIKTPDRAAKRAKLSTTRLPASRKNDTDVDSTLSRLPSPLSSDTDHSAEDNSAEPSPYVTAAAVVHSKATATGCSHAGLSSHTTKAMATAAYKETPAASIATTATTAASSSQSAPSTNAVKKAAAALHTKTATPATALFETGTEANAITAPRAFAARPGARVARATPATEVDSDDDDSDNHEVTPLGSLVAHAAPTDTAKTPSRLFTGTLQDTDSEDGSFYDAVQSAEDLFFFDAESGDELVDTDRCTPLSLHAALFGGDEAQGDTSITPTDLKLALDDLNDTCFHDAMLGQLSARQADGESSGFWGRWVVPILMLACLARVALYKLFIVLLEEYAKNLQSDDDNSTWSAVPLEEIAVPLFEAEDGYVGI